jgi:hypothetical protein
MHYTVTWQRQMRITDMCQFLYGSYVVYLCSFDVQRTHVLNTTVRYCTVSSLFLMPYVKVSHPTSLPLCTPLSTPSCSSHTTPLLLTPPHSTPLHSTVSQGRQRSIRRVRDRIAHLRSSRNRPC